MERQNDVFSFQSRLPIYGSRLSRSLRRTCIDSVDFVQRLKLEKSLDVHQGCVNSISWDETGAVILSGSDDKKLCITDPFSRKVLATAVSGHRSNIFSAQFLPATQNNQVVSCSGDGQISYTIVDREDTHGTNMFLCHYGTTYEVATVPGDPHTFLSCGEDGSVRWFDLRTKTSCTKDRCKSDILINCRRAVTTLAVNPMQPHHLAVGCSDSSVRVFDRRVLGTRAQGGWYSAWGIQAMFCRLCPPHMKKKYSRPTSLNYDRDGEEILVSYSTDYIYCFNLKDGDEQRRSAIDEDDKPDSNEGDSVNPVKRLRLRGDWSDTGPKARPRSERSGEEDPPPRISIVQRMSEMLSRWLEDTTPQHNRMSREESRRLSIPERSEVQQGSSPQSPDEESRVVSSRSQETRSEGQKGSSPQSPDEESRVVSSRSQETRSGGQKGSSPQSPDEESRVVSSRSQETRSEGQKGSSPQSPDEEAPVLPRGQETRDDGAPMEHKDNPTSSTSQASVSSKKRVRRKVDSNSREMQSEDTPQTAVAANNQLDANRKENDTLEEVSLSDSKPKGDVAENTKGISSETADFKDKKRKKSEDEVTDRIALKGSQRQEADGSQVNKTKKCRKSSREEIFQGKSLSEGEPSGDIGSSRGEESHGKGKSSREEKSPAEGQLVKKANPSMAWKSSGEEVQSLTRVEFCRESSGEGQSLREGESSMDRKLSGEEKTSRDRERRDEGEVQLSDIEMEEVKNDPGDKSDEKERNDSKGKDEGGDTPLALKERQEDWNPKDRSTKQFTDQSTTRRRKVSVSGIPGREPDLVPTSSGQGQSAAAATQSSEAHAEAESVSDLRSRFESGNVRPAARPHPRRVSPSRRLPHFRREVLVNADELDISDTDSDFDSDDDLVLRRPRRSSSSADESRDQESARRESAVASKSSRLKELFKNHRMRKEKEEEDMMRNVKSPKIKMVFKGHRNSRTMIKEATFWGNNHVLSGSDCGHVFIWDRHTGRLVMLLEGDRHVVNCIQPHPSEPILATSGIDYDIKIWSPSAVKPHLPPDAEEVIRINELMLEETRDTITIPPAFMLRMLASLNHLRTDARATGEAPESDSSDG